LRKPRKRKSNLSEPEGFDDLLDDVFRIRYRLLGFAPGNISHHPVQNRLRIGAGELVVRTDDVRYVVEIPGFEGQEVRTRVVDNELQITGPGFSKSVEVPVEIDPTTLKMECHNGVLSVRVKKK
jgi:HSP20 family molecular chaperone IbpA